MLVTNECPRRSLTHDSLDLIRIYSHYSAGNLWAAGGVSDQPNAYLDAMRLIEVWSKKLSQ